MADLDTLTTESAPIADDTNEATLPAENEATDNNALAVVDTDGTQVVASEGAKKKVKKIIKKKRRPARPQVDPATFKTEAPAQSGTIFNIW